MIRFHAWILLAALAGSLAAKPKEVRMQLSIAAFPREGTIPKLHTADGADHSPAISWSGVPVGTKALALVMDDPDAPVGLWTHWTLYDLPADLVSLPANLPRADLAAGGRQGKNSWGRLGWNGPSPPPGKPHRYFFRLYALSAPLGLLPGATRAQVDAALKNKILAEASWMGTYGR